VHPAINVPMVITIARRFIASSPRCPALAPQGSCRSCGGAERSETAGARLTHGRVYPAGLRQTAACHRDSYAVSRERFEQMYVAADDD
jgi:hypothetical protein